LNPYLKKIATSNQRISTSVHLNKFWNSLEGNLEKLLKSFPRIFRTATDAKKIGTTRVEVVQEKRREERRGRGGRGEIGERGERERGERREKGEREIGREGRGEERRREGRKGQGRRKRKGRGLKKNTSNCYLKKLRNSSTVT
jgi:hypothetical protein